MLGTTAFRVFITVKANNIADISDIHNGAVMLAYQPVDEYYIKLSPGLRMAL